MKVKEHEDIKDIKIIDNFNAGDNRGEFVKIYNDDVFNDCGIQMQIQEIFYSVSHKNVIRGMHFQIPPYDHDKLVHIIAGSVKDVIVDLRKESATYQKSICIELNAGKKQAVYIPRGFAHGFMSLEDNTVMMYMVSEGYSATHDAGIRWNSIDMDWDAENPVLSKRDSEFSSLKEYQSPF